MRWSRRVAVSISAVYGLPCSSPSSAVRMIAMGVLLATGQLTELSRWAAQSSLSRLALDLESGMRAFLLGR